MSGNSEVWLLFQDLEHSGNTELTSNEQKPLIWEREVIKGWTVNRDDS